MWELGVVGCALGFLSFLLLIPIALDRLGDGPALKLISRKVFLQSFCNSQFPHKSVNSLFISVIVKDKLTDLWGVDFCKKI